MGKYWVERFSKQQRVLILIGLLWLFFAVLGKDAAKYMGGGALLLWLLFPEVMVNSSYAGDKTKDMLQLLSVDGSKLRVGMEWVEKETIKKIALDKFDDTYATMQFPYTSKIPANYLFPLEQMEEVRAWLERNAPEIEIIR
ncbi:MULTISPECIES: hypothetical protein [Gammaproteobacteria]|uniref:hypothetical protein n=1 Tax=Gammaproteobacteria TaxID=1236 RepID=UPI000DD09BD4|nr:MULTISPECIES: hypothetical protein [Gammaproteobacteria]RTE86736.1 hypothetical protein DQX04_09315 [Aliidiomarina sp. B3213]TCZ90710.1 hypothetical protein EYQ95_07730 [Lysobacter sp. N42]